MSKKICLTGIKPTGIPHLGNYLGAMRPAINLANSGEYDGYFFIADYHSLTSVYDAKKLNEDIYNVAASWLACGLDPKKVTLYKQSDIPEILELNWILSCFCNKGLMNRAHAYKAKVQANVENKKDEDQGVNIGLFSYPVLMASDILFLNSDIVPVGPDQLQHLEIARDLVNAFNHHYGEILKEPKAIENETILIPGLDGRKMSKSYDNTIPLFSTEKKFKKLINKITTDSLPPEASKDPSDSTIFDLFCLFSTEQEQKDLSEWYKRGIGWGEAKAELFKVANREIAPMREKYDHLMTNKSEIDQLLVEGAKKVRPMAQKNLQKIKKVIGVSNV